MSNDYRSKNVVFRCITCKLILSEICILKFIIFCLIIDIGSLQNILFSNPIYRINHECSSWILSRKHYIPKLGHCMHYCARQLFLGFAINCMYVCMEFQTYTQLIRWTGLLLSMIDENPLTTFVHSCFSIFDWLIKVTCRFIDKCESYTFKLWKTNLEPRQCSNADQYKKNEYSITYCIKRDSIPFTILWARRRDTHLSGKFLILTERKYFQALLWKSHGNEKRNGFACFLLNTG